MSSNPFELYPAISQIAAVFAGFGSLASGIGQRSGGDDARVDAYRLGFMLYASLWTTLLGLLPATLSGLSLGDANALRLSAAVAAVALLIYGPLSGNRILKIRHVEGFSLVAGLTNTACFVSAFAAFAVTALGVSTERLPNLYLLGLTELLGSSIVMFSRVIVSMLRPIAKSAEAKD
jgi:hypothetical protein